MANELTAEQIAERRDGPLSATADGISVTDRSADDLLKLDQAAASKQALQGRNSRGGSKSGFRLLRMARAVPST